MSVTVKELSKRFGGRREVVGVDRVSFECPEHRITALLGPSGSGKSTLLRLVAGLEIPDGGAVCINGDEVTKLPVRERNVGFVFQNYALFSHMTVFENIAFGLKVRGAPASDIRARVSELLSLVQLQGYERRFPDQLSGGQRQRIALARALAIRPRVLLLDEPFGALDTQVRVELREWLHQLHEQTQVTTLLVTHDQEEALELSDHIVLLKDGQVEQAGTPSELYERPKSAFVAAFLGGAKIMTGRVVGGLARFADDALTASVDLAEGSIVEAFIRPHDVRLAKAKGVMAAKVARVERLVRVGRFVKLAVVLPDGDRLSVQMQNDEFEEHALAPGDNVLVDLRRAQVTPRINYTI